MIAKVIPVIFLVLLLKNAPIVLSFSVFGCVPPMNDNDWQYENVGHFEILSYQVATPFVKCYIIQIYYFLPNFLYCVLPAVLSYFSLFFRVLEYYIGFIHLSFYKIQSNCFGESLIV